VRLAWGFESLHPPLPLTRRLMRILGAIIEIPVLAMFYPWKKLALGVASILSGKEDSNRERL
jgi:hypothetical protein